MSYIKCYSVAEDVLNMASERFGGRWRERKDMKEALKRCCDFIDSFTEESGLESIEVKVDEISLDITVSLVCDCLVAESVKHGFFFVIRNTRHFKFKTVDNGEKLQIDFVFSGIWEAE